MKEKELDSRTLQKIDLAVRDLSGEEQEAARSELIEQHLIINRLKLRAATNRKRRAGYLEYTVRDPVKGLDDQ